MCVCVYEYVSSYVNEPDNIKRAATAVNYSYNKQPERHTRIASPRRFWPTIIDDLRHTYARKMNRFQVSSVDGEDRSANFGQHMANRSPVAGSAGEVPLNAYNLLAREMPSTTGGVGAPPGATSSASNGTDGAGGLQRKFSIQQLTR